ncbi:MAG: CsbD family protein [Candidatus Eisenbacteria bacterium]
MNWDRISGSWTQFRGAAKERWGELTDDDLDVIGGKYEQLVGTVQKRYGLLRDEAEQAVRDWADRADSQESREAERP